MTVAEVSPDHFRGGIAPRVFDRMYGGQVLAQALLAAAATVHQPLDPHSVHAYFLSNGDPDRAVDYAVERVRDSGRFANRAIRATQDGTTLAMVMCSFQAVAPGFEHQAVADAAPSPDGLQNRDDALMALYEGHPPRNAGVPWPLDIRHIDHPPWRTGRAEGRNRLWMRAPGPLPDEPLLHAALLLYASDLAMFEPVIAPLDVAWEDLIGGHGMFGASLDHAVWFHRRAHVDDWLLQVQRSPVATDSRGLSTGEFYDRAGRLVASATQEILIRATAQTAAAPRTTTTTHR